MAVFLQSFTKLIYQITKCFLSFKVVLGSIVEPYQSTKRDWVLVKASIKGTSYHLLSPLFIYQIQKGNSNISISGLMTLKMLHHLSLVLFLAFAGLYRCFEFEFWNLFPKEGNRSS